MMGAAYLVRYYIKRVLRHRRTLLAAFVLPVVCGIVRLVAPESEVWAVCRWLCPFACAAFACGWIRMMGEADRASGLMDGFRTTPLSDMQISATRAAVGLAVFAAQMMVFGVLAVIV